MATRKGMGQGKGKGYKNIIGKDPMVHSQSAKGRKQPQRVSTPTRLPMFNGYTIDHRLRQFRKVEFKNKEPSIKFIDFDSKQGKALLRKMGDKDGDTVPDKADCRPLDPTKQDAEIEKILQEEGVDILDKTQKKGELPKEKGELPKDFKEIKFDPTVEGEVSPTKAFAGKVGARTRKVGKSLFEKTKEFAKKEIAKGKERKEKEREVLLETVKHPKVKEIEKQRTRVEHLKETIATTTDSAKEEELFEELHQEQKQLGELHEDLTKINLQDFSDNELKTLAVRYKPSGLEDLFGSKNKFTDELVRRVKVRKEMAKKISEAEKEKPSSGFF